MLNKKSLFVLVSFIVSACCSGAEKSASQYSYEEPIQLAPTFDDNKTVLFAFNSSKLSSETKDSLNNRVEWMKENPKVKVLVEGNCDEFGSKTFNEKLGMERAEAVKGYLVRNGIASHRIKTVSYGKSRPLDKAHTEEAWAKNRRAVTITVVRN